MAEKAMTDVASGAHLFDLKVNYISDAQPDEELTARADVVHSGRRTVVVWCRIAAGARLIATASATFAATRVEEH
jgi:acyl-coenzyme A thioesterase PaaI-like protein